MAADDMEDIWDKACDVLVVGGGAAGFAAAAAAAQAGADVILIEKEDAVGGTTAKSGGYFWIPNNPLMRERGLVDEKRDALRYMARLSFPQLYDAADSRFGLPELDYSLIAAYYDRGPEAVEFFAAQDMFHSELDLAFPDYSADIPEDRAPIGRHLFPGGFAHEQAEGEPAWKQEEALGTRGAFLIERLQAAAEKRGAQVLLNHRANRIMRNLDGAVIGLEVRARQGVRLIRARKAVVFATGGFTHDPALATSYLRGPMFGGCAASGSTGDFIRMGIDVGAQLGNMNNAWWAQTAVELAVRMPTVRDCFYPFGDSMILVNRFGNRVVNEKMVYNERTQVHFEWNPTRREYSNLVLFQIYDDRVAQDPQQSLLRVPIPMPGDEVSYVISGNTWAELTSNLDARLASLSGHVGGLRLDPDFAENMKQTVRRFNAFARAGKDEDFGRGDTDIQLHWNSSKRDDSMPNPTMYPLADQGPYHAIILGAGALDTKGGPRIDTQARVLDVSGDPIPGLYGAGNCISSPAAQAYWSAGTTIGLALTFGYIAGSTAAHETVKEATLA
jgi:succinate dehydrogenase/fumarate reductase flavoprotein subunit